MTDTVIVGLISAGGTVLTAITALILNYRLFNSLEWRMEVIERELKEFFKSLAEHDKRISRLENGR
jgi:hypothetical protein